jgi:hypothetical protein
MAYGLERDTEDVDEVFILGTTHHIIALKLFQKVYLLTSYYYHIEIDTLYNI